MSKLKIGLFTDSFYPSIGGTESVVKELATYYIKLGCDVTVFCPCPPSKEKDKYTDKNFDFKVVRAKAIRLSTTDLYPLHITKVFKKQVEESNLDIIHCHTVSKISTYGLKYGRRHNIPVISTLHTKFDCCYYDATHSKLITSIMMKHLKNNLNKSNVVTTVSNNMVEYIKKQKVNNDIRIINNAMNDIDINISIDNNIVNKYNLDNKTLVFVGRIERYKNITFLLKSLKIVSSKKDIRCLIIGNGERINYYQKMINRLGLDKCCKLTGALSKKELATIYSKAYLHLFPSIFDSDGLTVREGMCFGTPTVAIENTGVSEKLINNVNGFLSENNINSYANKILELLDNEKLVNETSKNCINNKNKTWEDISKEYIELYKELIK